MHSHSGQSSPEQHAFTSFVAAAQAARACQRHAMCGLETFNCTLLIVLLTLISNNVEEAQLVYALAGADHAQPVAQLLLLEVLFRPGNLPSAHVV